MTWSGYFMVESSTPNDDGSVTVVASADSTHVHQIDMADGTTTDLPALSSNTEGQVLNATMTFVVSPDPQLLVGDELFISGHFQANASTPVEAPVEPAPVTPDPVPDPAPVEPAPVDPDPAPSDPPSDPDPVDVPDPVDPVPADPSPPADPAPVDPNPEAPADPTVDGGDEAPAAPAPDPDPTAPSDPPTS